MGRTGRTLAVVALVLLSLHPGRAGDGDPAVGVLARTVEWDPEGRAAAIAVRRLDRMGPDGWRTLGELVKAYAEADPETALPIAVVLADGPERQRQLEARSTYVRIENEECRAALALGLVRLWPETSELLLPRLHEDLPGAPDLLRALAAAGLPDEEVERALGVESLAPVAHEILRGRGKSPGVEDLLPRAREEAVKGLDPDASHAFADAFAKAPDFDLLFAFARLLPEGDDDLRTGAHCLLLTVMGLDLPPDELLWKSAIQGGLGRWEPPAPLSPGEIGASVARAVRYLRSRLLADSMVWWTGKAASETASGATALAVLSLLAAGVPKDDPAIRKAVEETWEKAASNWRGTVRADGWGYRTDGKERRFSMTSAGLSGLVICLEGLDPRDAAERVAKDELIRNALSYLGKLLFTNGFAGQECYAYYGVERACVLGGVDRFAGLNREYDWYREGAKRLLASQGVDGSWGGKSPRSKDVKASRGPAVDTAFALLFLTRATRTLAGAKRPRLHRVVLPPDLDLPEPEPKEGPAEPPPPPPPPPGPELTLESASLATRTGPVEIRGVLGTKAARLTVDGKPVVPDEYGRFAATVAVKVSIRDKPEVFTVECWVRAPAYPGGQRCILANTEASGFGLFWGGKYGPKLFAYVYVREPKGFLLPKCPTPWTGRRWTHIALTYDGAVARLYVGGREVASAEGKNAVPGTRSLYLGAQPNSRNHPVEHFPGQIDEVRLSDVVRYRDRFDPAATFLPDRHTLLLFHFDTDTPKAFFDASGRECHGRPSGSPALAAEKR